MIPRYSPPDIAAIWTEEAKMQRWLEIELAAVEARMRLGEVPAEDYEQIKKRAKFDVERILEIEKTTKHDVIAFLTNVAEHVGQASRHIHQGMTSSDVLDTALSMQLRDAGKIIATDIERLLKVLAKRAKEFKYTLQIGRTHGVHAEPITFGLKLALWYEEMKRNRERLKRAIENVSVGKISGAVGTFEHLSPKVEIYVCKKLGLKPEPIATQVIQRDRHAEYLCTLAIIAASIEKFAIECRHLQRTEVLEVEEFFSEGQKGSSAMPHKRNPITFERLTGLARIIRANALAALENIALWHERDISHSSVERIIMPDSTIALCYILRQFTDAIEKLIVYPERMLENFERSYGLIFSQAILLALTQKGLAREEAYQLVQRNAMQSWKEHVPLKTLVQNDSQIRAYLSEKEIEQIFSSEALMKKMKKNVDYIFRRVGLTK
ncbi:MAG: adenylosuccinate lyase [Candidatus Thermochlorobacter aerophilum]|uniref:Adenylosuccinate lyase n=1 Tax=Candidatus Thermochlorobacter aerophilus TaxID=1868324 RepID=A0A395LYY1_9BACT|nr:MAG: adenylosuccinate lyase [Candidatus Thermochlorobacter aerophilum]